MRAGDVDADGGGAFLVVAHRGEADADPRAQEENIGSAAPTSSDTARILAPMPVQRKFEFKLFGRGWKPALLSDNKGTQGRKCRRR